MAENVKIDDRFLEPFESVGIALETAQIPLLFIRASDQAAFVDQAATALGGTVIFTSQADFVEQMLASMAGFDYLFAVINEPLGSKPFNLIRGYLAARDIMGADLSAQAAQFSADLPHEQHRLILMVDRKVFDRHDHSQQQQLAELCMIIAVS